MTKRFRTMSFAALACTAAPLAAHGTGHAGQSAPVEAPDSVIADGDRPGLPARPAGSNMVLTSPIELAEGLEVIISDVIIPPGAQVPRHCHPGQEFLYLVEGSATHVEAGKPDLPMAPGDAYVIPAGAIHEPIGGPQGARAVVFRVHLHGREERVAVPEGNDNSACLAPQPGKE